MPIGEQSRLGYATRLGLVLELHQAAQESPPQEFVPLLSALFGSIEFDDGHAEDPDLLSLHAAEALRINRRIFAAKAPDSRPLAVHARAVFDSAGRVVAATRGFSAMLASACPHGGNRIPQRLRRAQERHEAGFVILVIPSPRSGRWLITARPLSARECLTERDLRIATEFGVGRSYAAVALSTGLTQATVRNAIQRAYKKLGITNKVQLAVTVDRRRENRGHRVAARAVEHTKLPKTLHPHDHG